MDAVVLASQCRRNGRESSSIATVWENQHRRTRKFREQFADDGLHLFGESERYVFAQQGDERFGAFGHIVEKAAVVPQTSKEQT